MNADLREAHVDDVRRLFLNLGPGPYESGVNHIDHALQAATLAEESGANPSQICAALLHDIGHLLLLSAPDPTEAFLGAHEIAAAKWLGERFKSLVVEPCRLHVAAKRYLCGTDPGFWATLSADSRASLVVQGGAFTEPECNAFLAQAYASATLDLRRWDDAAKIPGRRTPDLDHFLGYLNQFIV